MGTPNLLLAPGTTEPRYALGNIKLKLFQQSVSFKSFEHVLEFRQ